MKKYIYIIVSLLPFALQAQCIEENGDLSSPPCNGVISTDPNNSVNQERSDMKNTFDWRGPFWEVFHPLPSVFHLNNTSSINMSNPYTVLMKN